MDDTHVYKDLIGKTVESVEESEDILFFQFSDGSSAEWLHYQDCCESVVIDDVNGEWSDIVGSPLLACEERVSGGGNSYGTETWTFYTYRTIKGSVDVKWHGSSNGYYSESVNYNFKEPK